MWLVVELISGLLWFTPRKRMSEWLWSSKSPTYIFEGLHYLVTWSNGFCGGKGKRGVLVEKDNGMWHRNDVIIRF